MCYRTKNKLIYCDINGQHSLFKRKKKKAEITEQNPSFTVWIDESKTKWPREVESSKTGK